MNIVVGSAFRNSTSTLARYFQQIRALIDHAGQGHHVRVIAVEGDSIDGTWQVLAKLAAQYMVSLSLYDCTHGGPVFGSTEAPERFKALSEVGNCILAGIDVLDEVLLYVESDLIWDPHTVGTLIDTVYERRDGFDIVAPLVFAGEHFYDTYAFRKDGTRFSPFSPYHMGLFRGCITEVDSVGSCLAVRADIARKIRFAPGQVLPQWCDNVRASGYKIGVMADYRVTHP